MQFNYQDGSTLILNPNNKFASGGEGSIFMHPKNKNKCIKIYHKPKPHAIADAYKPLTELDSRYFVKPEKMLFNQKQELVGFEMSYIDNNKYFLLKKLTTKSFCDQNGYDRKFKFTVYKNLKAAIEDAHKKNIVIGDLNPYNIMVNDKGDIIFVDVDSYGTKTKQHSGVLLEDIRDWKLHPNVNHKTDAYAFDVLIFWMFTYLHPYRGVSKTYKTLEERVVKNASVLAKIPDLIIPPVYDPFSNQDIIKQFIEVFNNGNRFLIDLANLNVIPANITAFQPINLSSADLYIRELIDGVSWIDASDNVLCVRLSNGSFKTFNVSNYGAYNLIESFFAENVYVGRKNYLKKINGELHFNDQLLTNIKTPPNYKQVTINNTLFLLDEDNGYGYKIAIDNIIGNNIQVDRVEMYVPSVQLNDSIVHFIGDSYWLFLPNGVNHNAIKTDLKIKNAYYKNGLFCIEHIDNNKVKFGLFKVNGTKIDLLYELSDFSYFDVKGDFVFIPQDGKIDLISILRKELVMNITCPVCKPDSKLFQTNGGMIIMDNMKVFFINKKK